MSDNNDFDGDDFDLGGFDDDFDDLDSNKGTLGDLWRNNTFVKLGVILGAIAFIVLIFIIFDGDGDDAQFSQMRGGTSTVSDTPGNKEVSQNIKTAIEDVNTERLEKALRTQGSAIPMPVNAQKGTLPIEIEKPDEEDPLERWRRLQEDKITRAVKKKPQGKQEPEVDTRTPAIQALSQSMSAQMNSILGNQGLKGAKIRRISTLAYLEGLQAKEEAALEAERQKRAARAEQGLEEGETEFDILLPAGTIEYAQLITEANTDIPGPILAQIMTGPFKGARLIGSFEETYNYLSLSFNTIVLDGVDYSADAVAIDPNTTLPGLATDIDRRYFTRVVLPVAAEFISGFANALSESGTTTVTIQGDSITETTSNNTDRDQEIASGVAQAGEELSDIINEIKDNYPQLIRVRAGTPMGILFVDAVADRQNDQDATVSPLNQITDITVQQEQ